MEKWITNHAAASYRLANPADWTGRATTNEQGAQYWYQYVQPQDWHDGQLPTADFGIIGYVCDEGVRRNQGRLGAAAGAGELRKRLARLAWHHTGQSIADYGDVVCVDGKMEDAQMQLALMVLHLIEAGQTPIVLGGGHDVAYGHFCGVRAATEGKRVGIINFDAHFDLRPVSDQPNSGTPFGQILEETLVDYLVLGIQRPANTAELFEIAANYGVEYVLAEHCRTYQLPTIIHTLEHFLQRNDYVYLTIDLDGFSSAYAPGVSAPSPFGYSPAFVMAVLEYLLASGKVIAVDVAELNPAFDTDGATARLGAGLIDFMVGELSATDQP